MTTTTGPRMVLTSALGVVHDLATSTPCSEMEKLRWEFSQGTERYARVKGIQVIAWGLTGCQQCFGTQAAFREYVSTN
jgi:hypothetical protein